VPADAPLRLEHGGETYRFCGRHCLDKFAADSEGYLNSPAAEPARQRSEASDGQDSAAPSCCNHDSHGASAPHQGHAEAGTEYVCPMCPEVREPAPGACPSCGMALEPETPLAPATRTEYTCPMHPEIVQDGPGSCPKCGMALEPRTVAADAGPDPELIDMSRRFWGSAALALPVLLLAMVADLAPGWLPA